MSRVGLESGPYPVLSGRQNVERAGLGAMREVINEASDLSRRTEEDLDRTIILFKTLTHLDFQDPNVPWCLGASAPARASCETRTMIGCLWIPSSRAL